MQNILNTAFEYHKSGDLDKAEILYKELLENNFEVEDVSRLLATLYNSKSDYRNSVNILENAVEKTLCGFDVWFLLGLSYKNIFEFEKAEKAYLKALEFNSKSEDVCYNLASLYLTQNKPNDAIKYFKKCLELNPEDVEAKYFLSLAYFRIKDYETGAGYFENRLCRTTAIATQEVTYPNLMKSSKLWQGEDISDKVLYTYYEAGFGDMLMFARYIPELVKRCKKLIIKPQAELSELLRYNFGEIEVMDLFKDEKDFNFDYHLPFLSAPYALKLNNNDIFMHHERYLKAEPEKVKYYKEKFFNNDKLKIAIKWQGNTYYETDRVINVEAFEPLFKLSDIKVYSAQTFEGSEEFSKLASKYDIEDLALSFKDFSYTAAALENVDLVICSDTSLAHLAGAMGKPCIVLLPYNYNWRWHMDLTQCDWYDSVKLYRLGLHETWAEMMLRVVEEIDN